MKTYEDYIDVINNILPSLSVGDDNIVKTIENVKDYNSIKKKLILRPFNYEQSKLKLNNGIYKTIDKIALALYIGLGDPVHDKKQQCYLRWSLKKCLSHGM